MNFMNYIGMWKGMSVYRIENIREFQHRVEHDGWDEDSCYVIGKCVVYDGRIAGKLSDDETQIDIKYPSVGQLYRFPTVPRMDRNWVRQAVEEATEKGKQEKEEKPQKTEVVMEKRVVAKASKLADLLEGTKF